MKESASDGRWNEREAYVLLLRELHRDGMPDPSLIMSGGDKQFLGSLPDVRSFEGSDPGRFMDDLLFVSLLSKSDFLDLGIDRAASAAQSFLESESSCQDVNLRLFKSSPAIKGLDGPEALRLLRRKISNILYDDFSFDEMISRTGFGPGAAVGIPRRVSLPEHKVGCKHPTTTAGCFDLALATLRWYDLWNNHLEQQAGSLQVVPGNKVVTVPKNAKTDRTIAIEPLMNGFVQKGIGAMIRSRLAKVGVNLNDQGDNQFLACVGSKAGGLATLDLSRASDSLALEVVRALLPSDWLYPMELSRSARGVLASGEMLQYQKFSSMGNGFTFELESLIFYAALLVVAEIHGEKESILSVYGDDLICPLSLTGDVINLLGWLGFEINLEKSYFGGVGGYRESCGKHFYHGVDVTPFYIRTPVQKWGRLVWFANQLKRWAHQRIGVGYGCDGRFLKIWERIVSAIPHRYRSLSIPDGYGDGALIRDFCEAVPDVKCSQGQWEGFVTSHFCRVPRSRRLNGESRLIVDLLNLEAGQPDEYSPIWRSRDIPLPGSRYAKKRLIVRQWRDLGPWM